MDPVQATVEVDDLSAAGALMQSVHILGDHRGHRAEPLQTRQMAVGGRRSGGLYRGPAEQGAAPVTLTLTRFTEEFRVGDGLAAQPDSALVAIRGYTAGGADAGAAQDQQRQGSAQRLEERLRGVGRRRGVGQGLH